MVARVLGPTLRGEYAAVTAWFGVVLLIAEIGQTAAVCFYVAHEPDDARGYLATSRTLVLAASVVTVAAGMLVAPVLARGNAGLTTAYRIAFATLLVALVRTSYTYALQARDLHRWNTALVLQPALSLVAMIVLWRLRLLTLDSALIVIAASILAQLAYSYWGCRRPGLAPGRAEARFAGPLVRYGIAQTAALAPASLNSYLDQLVLSQTVAAAVLGRYAIAVSCTLLPLPVVTAIAA